MLRGAPSIAVGGLAGASHGHHVLGVETTDRRPDRYVPAVDDEVSGRPIPLRGRAFIRLTIRAHAAPGLGPVGGDLVPVAGFAAFQQVTYAGTRDDRTSYGIGVTDRLPFRVSTETGFEHSSYLLLDVAHS
ncbi:MAG: hypothetical protein JWM05_628 [Acidimicrobiales bacterium]|nr:hypothetical protein [Acidimicrobiales bacterium]